MSVRYTRYEGVQPGIPCASCSAPIETTHYTQWCACPLCGPCAKGIVYSCPVCGAHPAPTTDSDIGEPVAEAPRDLSGMRWIALLIGSAVTLLVLDWWLA